MSVKEQVRIILERLDDNSTWDDAFEEFEIMAALDESIQEADAGLLIPHEEVMKMFDRRIGPNSK